MAFRSDITFNFEESPRVATVDAPSVELSVQDMHDTFTDVEDSIIGHQFDNIILSAGKEDLGGGVLVGITSELQNIQVTFEDRSSVWDTASVTTPDANGVLLTDSASTFVTDLVTRGDLVVNSTDGSHATVLQVVSETQLDTQPLAGGIDNQYDTSDVINIFNIYRCTVSGGNTVAIDDVGAELDPVLQSFGTQIKVSSSSSATLSEQSDIQYASFEGAVHFDITGSVTGTEYPAGNAANPINNLTDMAAIDSERGFNIYDFRKSATISNEASWEDKTFIGHSIIDTVITVGALADVTKAVFFTCSIEGALGATTLLKDCFLGETNPLTNVRGVIEDCSIGPSPLTLGGSLPEVVRFVDCRGAGLELAPPTLNLAGDGPEVDIQGYIGQLNIANKTGEANLEISINGKLTLDSTVTNGIVVVNGTGTLVDNSGPGCLVIDNMIQGAQLREVFVSSGLDAGNPFTKTPSSGSSLDGLVNVTYNRQQSLMNYGDAVTEITTRVSDPATTFSAPLISDVVDDISTATGTFTRASSGSYISPTTGFITSATTNEARFESEGLLIEEARTNLCPQSEDLATTWSQNDCTIVTDSVVAPDGATTMDKIEETATTSFHGVSQLITVTSGIPYTQSFYVQAAERSWVQLIEGNNVTAKAWFNLSDGSIGIVNGTGSPVASIEDFGGGIYRCSLTFTPISTVANIQARVARSDGDSSYLGEINNGIYCWGAQMEQGEFSSSYLATTTGSVARSADFLSYGDDTVVVDAVGSIFAEYTPLFGSTVPNDAVVVNIADQQIGPLYIDDDATQKVTIGDGTTIGVYDPTLAPNTTTKIASRWTTGFMQIVAGGNEGTEVAYDNAFTRSAGTLYIGSDSTGNHINGNIKNVIIYNTDRGVDQLKVDTG